MFTKNISFDSDFFISLLLHFCKLVFVRTYNTHFNLILDQNSCNSCVKGAKRISQQLLKGQNDICQGIRILRIMFKEQMLERYKSCH